MITETKKLELPQGIELRLNILESGKNKWLIATHGLGEHSGRHKYLLELFSEHYNICLYDLRGHGKSTGKKAYIDDFTQYSSDLLELLKYFKKEYLMKDYSLLGHSMGGLIVADYMQNKSSQFEIPPLKVFLSGPAISGTGAVGHLFNMVPLNLIEKLKSLPSIPMGGILDLSKLSHDPRVYESYVTDELNLLKIHSKLFIAIISRAKEVFSRPLNISSELYCAFGSLDGLVDAKSIKGYFETHEKKAVLCEVEGGYHELHNEIEKYRSIYFDFLKKSLI